MVQTKRRIWSEVPFMIRNRPERPLAADNMEGFVMVQRWLSAVTKNEWKLVKQWKVSRSVKFSAPVVPFIVSTRALSRLRSLPQPAAGRRTLSENPTQKKSPTLSPDSTGCSSICTLYTNSSRHVLPPKTNFLISSLKSTIDIISILTTKGAA